MTDFAKTPKPSDTPNAARAETAPPRPQRKGATSAVAAVRMEALALWVIERSADFPKRHKFTLGERWVEANLRVVECLLEATFQKDKRASLLGASRGLVRARVLARLGHGVGALAPKQWTYFDRESLEVGRMVGGWLRSASGSARMRTGPDHLGAQDVNEAVAFGPSASSRGEEGQAPTG